jgi:ABC-type Fe3+/spermidine/putrescine transport system ATPase subunit
MNMLASRYRAASDASAGEPRPVAEPAFLEVDRATVRYGNVRVLEDLSLSVAKGEFVALLGSSGCGKTTLLRTIAGFMQPVAGRIVVGGRDVTRQPPDKRGMALVFQTYALWPHMTVAQNIGYGLKLRRKPRAEIAAKVAEMQALLGLEGLGGRKPAALSGGQRQRVALGRALAIGPDILLLDEPLSNLDARIRLTVRHEISALQKRLGITAIHVTHDREEAMVMADRIVILNAGRIAQLGTPQEVYNNPASPFVAAFMGAENVMSLTATVKGGKIGIKAGPTNRACEIGSGGRTVSSGRLEARFRSEAAALLDAKASHSLPGEALILDGTVMHASYPGGVWRHVVRIGEEQIVVDSSRAFASGESVSVRVPAEALFLFDAIERNADGRRPETALSRD